MGSALAYEMGQESPAERDIFNAVESALDGGVSAAQFLEIVREAWDYYLSKKMKADDAVWVAAKKGASA